MAQTSTIARNTAVQTIGKIASIFLGWVTVLAMTRTLGAEGFGAYTIITAYLQFFGVASDFGFVLVSSQMLAELGTDAAAQEKLFANLFTFRLATALAALVLAPVLIWLFPYSPLVKVGVVILVFSFLLSAIQQVYTGLFQKELVVGRILIGELISRVVLLLFIGVALMRGGGLPLMLVGIVVGALANTLFLGISAGQFVRLKLAFDGALWKTIWHRSWPLVTTIVLNLIYLKADTLILSLTRSQAEVGVYGAAYRVFEVLITFPTMFASLLVPILANARARGDEKSFVATAQHGFRTMVYAVVPMLIGVFFVATPVAAIFGPDFVREGPLLLEILVVANAAVFLGTYCAHLVVAVNEQRKMIVPFGITAVVAMVGYLIFIPLFGALGAACMTVVAEVIIAFLSARVARATTRVSLPFWSSLQVALIAAVPMIVWLAISPLLLVGKIIIAAILYVAGLIAQGVVPHDLFLVPSATKD